MLAVSSNSSLRVDTKTVKPALRQTVTAISTTNTRCTIFKRDSFDIKAHVVYKILALVLAVISLLDQPKTLLLSLHLEKGVTFFVSIVCRFLFLLKSQVFSPTNYAMEFLLLFFQLFFWEKGRRGRGLVPSVVIRSQQILDSSDAFLAMCRCFFT